jgi:hypothetical protein
MAAQQGFKYEVNASDTLKKLNFVPKNFTPAGAGHDQPDLMIKYGPKEAGCELKITDASAGSLVIKFLSIDPKRPKWGFDTDVVQMEEKDPEKAFIMLQAVMEYHLPKLARVESVGDEAAPQRMVISWKRPE